jgi:hypothetical protein
MPHVSSLAFHVHVDTACQPLISNFIALTTRKAT